MWGNPQQARMAEWSKAVDLRPTIVRCEGSNPSSCKFIGKNSNTFTEKYLNMVGFLWYFIRSNHDTFDYILYCIPIIHLYVQI